VGTSSSSWKEHRQWAIQSTKLQNSHESYLLAFPKFCSWISGHWVFYTFLRQTNSSFLRFSGHHSSNALMNLLSFVPHMIRAGQILDIVSVPLETRGTSCRTLNVVALRWWEEEALGHSEPAPHQRTKQDGW
jgi:hypothetical protein